MVMGHGRWNSYGSATTGIALLMFLPHSGPTFSFAWILVILQVGPRIGILMDWLPPTHPPIHHSPKLDNNHWITLGGVLRVSGWCPEGVWKVSGRCLEDIWKVSGRCRESVGKGSCIGYIATLGLHLGFSAKLKILQVPACKMEPRSGYIMRWGPPTQPPTVSVWNEF